MESRARWVGPAVEPTPAADSPPLKYLIETLPSLPPSPTNPEDVDTDGPDHAYDSLRYFLMSRPRASEWTIKQRDEDTHPGVLAKYRQQVEATKRDDPAWRHRYTPGKERVEAGW